MVTILSKTQNTDLSSYLRIEGEVDIGINTQNLLTLGKARTALRSLVSLEKLSKFTEHGLVKRTEIEKAIERATQGGTTLDPKGYLGHTRWPEASQLLPAINPRYFMPSPQQLGEVVRILGSNKAYDGSGKKIRNPERILNSLLIPESHRNEHLNARFHKEGNNLLITFPKIKPDGTIEQITETLEDCIMKQCSIDLSSLNRQGMPTRKGNDAVYYPPADGSVAWLGAYSDRSDLYCSWDLQCSGASLGVRVARILRK